MIVQQELDALGGPLRRIAEELAANRLTAIRGPDRTATVATRPYRCVLTGLMDTQDRVATRIDAGNGGQVLNTLAKVFPEALSEEPLLVPLLAGDAAANPNPAERDQICGRQHYTALLRKSPHARAFQAAVASDLFKVIEAGVTRKLKGFDESRVLADLEQELSLLTQAREACQSAGPESGSNQEYTTGGARP
jgi:hypothetical protein